ncbi:MAG: histidine phosphatase family protein [Armatimonadetes bacterium]|nr:histidine phosphatase family protein [Armatimonadota bacterium]
MGRIYLIRHGQTTWNSAASYAGSTDVPLNDQGIAQAVTVADRLESLPIKAVFSSGLSRAVDTARIIAERFGLIVTQIPELNELDYGDWEGMPEIEVPVRYPRLFTAWRANPAEISTPGGETFGQLCERALPALLRIAEENRGRDIVVVAHKSTNRALICCLTGRNVNEYRQVGQDNTAINILESGEDGRVRVEQVNLTDHLSS